MRKTTDDLEIIDDNGYIVEYYSYIDKTACKIDITFNMSVSSGDVTINFYDSGNNLLSTSTTYFISYGNYIEDEYISINGKVDSYEIISYSVEPTNHLFIIYILLPFSLIFFISSLFVSYKKYSIYGNEIIVYAGFYHNYIKINGEKYDEYNTTSYTPIYLSCIFNENLIEVKISMSNRISTKLNGKLLKSNKD